MNEPTEEMILAGIAASPKVPYVSDAQCVAAIWKAMQAARAVSPKVPLEQWIAENAVWADKVYPEHANFSQLKKYVCAGDLRDRLEGMAIVPVEPTEAMLVAARDWSYKKYSKPIGNDAAQGCWQSMLAATKEKGE